MEAPKRAGSPGAVSLAGGANAEQKRSAAHSASRMVAVVTDSPARPLSSNPRSRMENVERNPYTCDAVARWASSHVPISSGGASSPQSIEQRTTDESRVG